MSQSTSNSIYADCFDRFRDDLDEKIDELRALIEARLPEKGDSCETSQKVALRLALSKFSQEVNGLMPFDMVAVPQRDLLGLEKAEETYNEDPHHSVYRFTMMAEGRNFECIGCAYHENELEDLAKEIASENDLESDDLLVSDIEEIHR